MNAIEVSALTMNYGDREVLRGVDFEVASGEVFCLLGPNGAGKTTTVEILEGFRQRTSGNVSVLGMDPQAQPTKLRERIGIVLQECGFPRQARVKELIDCWRSYYPKPRETADLLRVVELDEDKNTQVRKLSGGQRRRLDLALALAGRSRPDLPRRAHHRLRPRVAASLLGGDREPAHARQDGPAHHPLPGRGGAAGRPGGDPARRPDPGGGHGPARRQAGGRADQDLVHRPPAAP